METSVPATYLQLIRTAWTYISTGALRRLMWMRKGPVIAALYPVGMLILQLLIAVGMGAVPHALLSGFGKIDAIVGYRAWARSSWLCCGGSNPKTTSCPSSCASCLAKRKWMLAMIHMALSRRNPTTSPRFSSCITANLIRIF
jgi:hypothetical protein